MTENITTIATPDVSAREIARQAVKDAFKAQPESDSPEYRIFSDSTRRAVKYLRYVSASSEYRLTRLHKAQDAIRVALWVPLGTTESSQYLTDALETLAPLEAKLAERVAEKSQAPAVTFTEDDWDF